MSFRVILHIGTNKTGTSAIQRFFHDRQDELRKCGVLYPWTGRRTDNHHPLSRLLGFGPPLDIDPATRARQLAETRHALELEIAEGGLQAVVFSSENFMLPRPIEPVVRFFEAMDVHVLVYLRRHDQWRESAYNQGLRMVANPPWPPGFEAWLDYQESRNPKYGDYRLLVDTWSAAFGKDKLVVRPYEKQQNQPDLVTDCLRAVSLEEAIRNIDKSVSRVNEALSMKAVGLLAVFQRLDVDPKLRAKLVKYALSLEPDAVRTSVVPPAVRLRLVEDNQADYEYIAREYLSREDGRLFYDPLPDPAEAWRPPQCLTAEDVEIEKEKALSGKRKWGLLK